MLTLFLTLVAMTALTRLVELTISRRHRRDMVERGARASEDPGFGQMVALHIGILLASVVEVLWLDRAAVLAIGLPAAVGVIAASALRVWTIATLGTHWNVRIVDSTSLGIVSDGPFRWIRHPNYVAVFAELALLPLVHGAWLTAVVGTAMHVLILRRRIAVEEQMLLKDEHYRLVMGPKPRFVPRMGKPTTRSRQVPVGARASGGRKPG